MSWLGNGRVRCLGRGAFDCLLFEAQVAVQVAAGGVLSCSWPSQSAMTEVLMSDCRSVIAVV